MAVTLYTSTGCSSSRKARVWLEDNHIPFIERNLDTDKITREEIQHLLVLSERGFDDIVSVRSKAYLRLGVTPDDLTTAQMINLILHDPHLLRRPIIVDERRVQIGFHPDEIRRFLPRDVRAMALQQAQLLAGF
ncbi:transcriptional regulator Spx [Lacticaseibacillus sp. N501-2]|uniref:transcriptional regulator Spx n=1 Tax=Lacticaseibacillus salsurae TaxID=3367729 RepID=UPI0038B261AB